VMIGVAEKDHVHRARCQHWISRLE
jgi:hypothetical protein